MATSPTTRFNPTGVWLEYPGGLENDDVGLLEDFAKSGGAGVVLEPFITRVRAEVMNLGGHLRELGLQVIGIVPSELVARADQDESMLEAFSWVLEFCDATIVSFRESDEKPFAGYPPEHAEIVLRKLESYRPGLLEEKPRLLLVPTPVPQMEVLRAVGHVLAPHGLVFDRPITGGMPMPLTSADDPRSQLVDGMNFLEGIPPALYAVPEAGYPPLENIDRILLNLARVVRDLGVTGLLITARQYADVPGVTQAAHDLSSFPEKIPPVEPPPVPGEETQVAGALLSDRPLSKADIAGPDRLGYAPYAAALYQLISHEETGLPLSIAVSAPWGSGKTSIMRWVQAELDMHREGEQHLCTVVPGVRRWPSEHGDGVSWWRRAIRMTTFATRVNPEEPEHGLGLVRRCRTVWIDAWKFENSAALWAAFTKEIYQQAQQQSGGPIQRLKFRLALANAVKPIDAGIRWRSVILSVLKNRRVVVAALVSFGAAGVGGFYVAGGVVDALVNAAVVSSSGDVAAAVPGVAGTASALVGLLGGAITWAKGWLRQPFSFDLNKVTAATLARPEPVDNVSASSDIELLVQLLAPGKEDGLVVFVDDLDRCSPDKVKDAVEAINLLFNGSHLANTVFVLGMDADMVAASMRVAYRPMVVELTRRDNRAATDFGHRFLSKIVQLTFNIPPPQEPALASYMDGLIGAPSEALREAPVGSSQRTPRREMSGQQREDAERRLTEVARRAETTKDRLEAVEAVVEQAPEEEREAMEEMAVEVARTENLRALRADSPEVQKAIREGARFLLPRPRDYKRFVNAVRLQLLVHNQSLKRDRKMARATNAQVAKWTALGMRWPVLAEEIRNRPEILGELEDWAADGSRPMQEWPRRVRKMTEESEFKKALAEKPLLGTVELHGLLSVN